MKHPDYVKRVKKLLEKIEWANYAARLKEGCCPNCGYFKSSGHLQTCELKRLRREEPE